MSTLKLDTLSNKAGTASVPSDTVVSGTAKAWVSFNGTGTPAVLRAFNVSSITDNGTGNYQVNFTSSLANTTYSGQATAGGPNSGNSFTYHATIHSRAVNSCGVNTTAYNVGTVLADSEQVHVAIFS